MAVGETRTKFLPKSVRKDGQSPVIDSLQDLFLSSLNTFLKGSKYVAPKLKYGAPQLKYGAGDLKYVAVRPAKMTHPLLLYLWRWCHR